MLVKVHAASVNALDWHFLTGSPFLARIMAGGLLKPKQTILGVDLAGRVEAVGGSVTRFPDRRAFSLGTTASASGGQGAPVMISVEPGVDQSIRFCTLT